MERNFGHFGIAITSGTLIDVLCGARGAFLTTIFYY